MNVKNSIKKALIFLIMLAMVVAFTLCFGLNNLSIGVMGTVLSIFLLKNNLRKNLKVNFLKILFTNLIMEF